MHWRRKWQPTPVFLPGESQGREAWLAAIYGVAQSQTRLSDFPFTFHFHELEKEMATHSSVLAWRIPGTGSLGFSRQEHWSGLPGESQGREAWLAAVCGVAQSRT